MEITIEQVEFYILVLVRITAFIYAAPIFSISSVPNKAKVVLSVVLTLIVSTTIGTVALEYTGTIGLAGLVVKEFLVGLILGFFANVCTRILSFSGQLLDMEIGFSMANVLDPLSSAQVTVSGNLFTYLVMLTLLITDMYHYLIRAIIASFTVVPIGQAIFTGNLHEVMIKFINEFFIIGFRIILPVFSAILIVNVVLAILAKASPQMNMFVVGFQLKIIVGLLVVTILVTMIPAISNFIFEEMKTLMELVMLKLAGS